MPFDIGMCMRRAYTYDQAVCSIKAHYAVLNYDAAAAA